MKKLSLIIIALFACLLIFTGCRKEEYLVTFNPNGGKGDLITQMFTQKVKQSLMANSFTHEGYAFTGWNTDPNGSGISYGEKEAVIIKGHLVLYAQWQKSSRFTVTFHPNGGEYSMDPQIFDAGVSQALSPNKFYYDGYEFSHWNTAPYGDGQELENKQNIIVSSNMTLYAQWKSYYNTVFVYFDPNGGTGNMPPQPFFTYEYQRLDTNTFTRTDYTFAGWNTKPDGKGYSFLDNQNIEIRVNMKLYAQWVKTPEPCPGIPTVTDGDGNTYNTVQIGAQCWIKENLRTKKYNNGENIPVISDAFQWEEYLNGALCFYNNNEGLYAERYGALYNGFAVYTGILCPNGWHVPSIEEWNALAEALGGASVAGFYMKTATDWPEDWYGNATGNNQSGFTALPAGSRICEYYYTNFYGLGHATYFWTSSTSTYEGIAKLLNEDTNSLSQNFRNKNSGLSVRCIKD
jgi:uncharacterized protein (TIGR02145 family)/uncharacterized repeat protein (TIGR02543 family)